MAEDGPSGPAKHRDELIARLDTLRRGESFCDVTVTVTGKEFKAHKVVLAAASPFFLSLWESNMQESNEQMIEIKLEEATASVMEDVLQYIYTGNLSVTEESCHKLIATADYLLLPGLKTLACGVLLEKLTIENCLFSYYFADKYHCEELKRECCRKVNSNYTAVMKTGDFLDLNVKQVMEWMSSDDIEITAEEEVFEGIVKWVSHNRSERESCFPDLLQQVRLRSVSQSFLLKKLVKEDLVTTNIDCLNFVLGSMESIVFPSNESLTKAPRDCLKVLMDGIFVCGNKSALCYLPDDNKWYELADMIFEHQQHAVVQNRNKVYIFSMSGFNVYDQSHRAEYYVPSTNSFGAVQTNFEFVVNDIFSSLSVVSIFSSLYAVTESDCESEIVAYNEDENKWTSQGEGLIERWGALGVADEHHLYIIGGTYTDEFPFNGLTKVERFNPVDKSLEEVAPLNERRHAAFGTTMNHKIYVAGGVQKNGEICTLVNSCEVYEPSTNEWHMLASLCVPRHSASMVCFKGALYVIGGLKNTSNEFRSRELSVEMFDSETSEWKRKSTIPIEDESVEDFSRQFHYKACFATIHKDVLHMYSYPAV